jgi:Icc-related predicted phosphoesterase
MARKFLLYFTTDIHGSELCFRKFLNAGKFYGAQMILLGGDVAGKMIVPLVRDSQGALHATYMGQSYTMRSDEEVTRVSTVIKTCGHYPYVIDEAEYSLLDTREKMDEKFRAVLRESLAGWAQLAEDRLKGSGIRCLITPGNDDLPEVDEVLGQSQCIENPEGKALDIDGIHELIATGYSNPTPWKTERELPEDELEEKIEELFRKVKDPSLTVASLHAPPHNTALDAAPELKDFKVQTSGGQPLFVSVGSTAVRKMLEKYQPQVGLHGHIHESRGIAKVGRTVCVNPGSEYTEGVLSGAIIAFEKERLVTYQLVTG